MSEIDQLLAESEQAVREAEKEADEANDRLALARQDRDALRRMVARLRGTTPPTVGSPEVKVEWRNLTRPDAVLRMLQEHDEPMSPVMIADALMQAGRERETPALMYPVLDKLKKRGQIVQFKHGFWTTTDSVRSNLFLEGANASP